MDCVCCGSAAVTERPERTAEVYRRFRCRDCGRQFNEPSAGVLNRAQYPSDVIALVVLWRLLYRLTLRDLCEMFLHRGLVFSHEAVRDWDAKLAPALAGELRRRRHGKDRARGQTTAACATGAPRATWPSCAGSRSASSAAIAQPRPVRAPGARRPLGTTTTGTVPEIGDEDVAI